MLEEISSLLLALVKEQGLIDDLQYEEVVAEVKRSGTAVFQILQDFGVMDADAILQAEANQLGTEVVSLRNRDLPAQAIAAITANAARTYRCIPIELNDSTLRVAFEDPLDPTRVDELTYVAKLDIQIVVANPTKIENAIEKYYSQETNADVTKILKKLS